MRLLIVEDDPQLGQSLARGLRERTYAVDLATDGDSGSSLALVNSYDAIVLDVMLPDGDGFALAQHLRHRGLATPILFLTALDAVSDRIQGLDSGGDDYLTKPFDFGELLARLRALLRRPSRLAPDRHQVGDLVVDTRRQVVSRAGRSIPLTAKEYAVLEFLARHADRVVSRAELTEHVWDDNHEPMSNTLDVFISRLRRKVDGREARPLLHTRRRSGYILSDLAAPAKDE
ncbi:MAG: response regulator transcription factor [Gemmatimonadaceae bacterium]